jgi:antitoxin component YwqK of YwqJK toxin-antitoxin module
MKQIMLAIILLIGIGQTINAQSPTKYFDSEWQPTTSDKATYYRPEPTPKDSGFIIEDYYMSGQLQMRAYSLSNTEDLFHGDVTWYNANGTLSQTASYKQGVINGELVSYNTYGDELARGTYVDGVIDNGTVYKTYETVYGISEYQNGRLMKTTILDGCAKPTKAKVVSYFKDDESIEKGEYYDQTGTLIGSMESYNWNGSVIDGTEAEFAINPLVVKSIVEKKNGFYTTPRKFFYSNGNIKSIEYFAEPTSDSLQLTVAQVFFDANKKQLDSLVYVDGLPHTGKQYIFNNTDNAQQNDTVNILANYANGFLQGKYTTYYSNGSIMSSVEYNQNVPIGTKTTFDAKGSTLYTLTYQDGQPWQGSEMVDGNKNTYQAGNLTEETSYFPNKKVKTINKYANGSNYETSWYAPDGALLGTLTTNANYQRSGTEVETDEEGWPTAIREYAADSLVSAQYFKDKKLVCKTMANGTSVYINPVNGQTFNCTFVDDMPVTGTVIEYEYDYSNILSQTSYKDGLQHGQSITYQVDPENGATVISSEVNYVNGKLHGISTQYHNGKPLSIIPYSDDNINGEASYFDDNHQLLSKVTYNQGLPINGTVYEYDYTNRVASSTPYKSGLRTGEAYYYEYGNTTAIETYLNDTLVAKTSYCSFLADTTLTMLYTDAQPWDGQQYDYGDLSTYKDGQLLETVTYNTETGFPSSKKVYNPEGHHETKFFDNGNIFVEYDVISDLPHGTVSFFNAEGKKIATGTFQNGLPVSGTFVARNLYSEGEYIIISPTEKSLQAQVVVDGKTKATISCTFTDKPEDPSKAFTDFIMMLQTAHSDYEFDLFNNTYGY